MMRKIISPNSGNPSERDETDRNIAHRIQNAIDLIGQLPEYYQESRELGELLQKQRIRFNPDLPDRGQASLTGIITLGQETMEDSLLSLAETLIHENYHRHQNHLLKTASFWGGVFSRQHPMQRYERPAYEASLRFLRHVSEKWPELADISRQEAANITNSFRHHYGSDLLKNSLSDYS
jgi:hypothetical protein